MKHIIIAKVDNKPGVVSRISGLFTRRGYNIESLVTGMTSDPSIYHMTVTMIGTEEELSLLVHQLQRIVEVIEVYRGDSRPIFTRELVLMKLLPAPAQAAEAFRVAAELHCTRYGNAENTEKPVLLEFVGNSEEADAVIAALSPFGIAEIVRSGAMSIACDGADVANENREDRAE